MPASHSPQPLSIQRVVDDRAYDRRALAALLGLTQFAVELVRGMSSLRELRRFGGLEQRLDLVALGKEGDEPGKLLGRNRRQAGDLADPLLGALGEGRIAEVADDLAVVVLGGPVLGPPVGLSWLTCIKWP